MENNYYNIILTMEREKNIKKFEPITLAATTLQVLKPIARKVLIERFGLDGKTERTLQEIGESLRITRERVRQIEKNAINDIKNAKLPEYEEFIETLHNTMQEAGGYLPEKELLAKLSNLNSKEVVASLKFLLTLDDLVKVEKIGKVVTSWALKTAPHELVIPMCGALEEILGKENKLMTKEELLAKAKEHQVFQNNKHLLTDEFIHTSMPACENISLGIGGKMGLSHWKEVTPKSLRDKVYWVLSKANKPMHFSEIAQTIGAEKFKKAKQFTVAAVHNELIADPRVVLVGRGIYALREWGYETGTVSDIIRGILNKAENPMKEKEIVDSVLVQRKVKEATILFNLRRSKEFIKKEEGYVLARPLPVTPKPLPTKIQK